MPLVEFGVFKNVHFCKKVIDRLNDVIIVISKEEDLTHFTEVYVGVLK